MSAVHTFAIHRWETRRRRAVVGLTLGAIALFAGSWFLPWWNFQMWAPQYPNGLTLLIHLTGLVGDVAEINIINHYIGMHSLDEAAVFERAYSEWLVGGLCLAVAAAVMLVGRRLNAIPALFAVGFPLGFIADTQYQLWHAGHDLDATAPIRMKPFWPAMFGEGKVGQFRTEAIPGLGFWLAMAGVALVAVAVWQRMRVCRVCPGHDACGVRCAPTLIGGGP